MKTIFEETQKIKNLMFLTEQNSFESFLDLFNSGDYTRLKEFLSTNSELVEKLKSVLGVYNIDSIYDSLLKSNKTKLMKGLSQAKMDKDMDFYKFLEVFLKNADSIR